MINLDILYEDNHIIVAQKPVGVMSQGDISEDPDMLTLLKNYLKGKYDKKGNVYLGLVHRLDTVTSGVMVFAKTSKAASRLSDAIRRGDFEKKYLAVLEGNLKSKSGILEDLLAKNKKINKVFVTKDDTLGKKAILKYKVLVEKDNTTLVKVDLLTGRTHQVRVQFAERGHPIVGDIKYGAKKRQINRGIALHACELSFPHPTKKEIMTFKSEPYRQPFTNFVII